MISPRIASPGTAWLQPIAPADLDAVESGADRVPAEAGIRFQDGPDTLWTCAAWCPRADWPRRQARNPLHDRGCTERAPQHVCAGGFQRLKSGPWLEDRAAGGRR